MAKNLNRAKGVAGENLACEYLGARGFEILARNFSGSANFHGGEIDIIAKKGETVHFIEVKSRTTDRFGVGREAVDRTKQRTIRAVASRWLAKNGLFDRVFVSFDVVEIMGGAVDLYEDCF